MRNKSGLANQLLSAFLFILMSFSININAQVKGKVYDAQTDLPIEGVKVSCNNKSVETNKDGSFLIESTGGIIFEHFGYLTDSITQLNSDKEIIISLIPRNLNLNEIVVKGLLHQSKLKNIPASVSLLKKSDLELISGISYLDKLNQLPGIFVHTGTFNTNRITIRGIGSRTPYGTNRVKAFYNDIPLTSADGTTNIEDIDKALINSIDIYKGPKSAVYGAGLGGIILLSDKNYLKEGWHGELSAMAGMFETYNPVINLHYKKNKLSVAAFYSNAQSNGFRQNNSYMRNSSQIKLGYKTQRNSTEMFFHYIDLNAQIPSSLNFDDFTESPDIAASNWLSVEGHEKYRKLISGLSNEMKINDKISNKTVLYANISDSYESRPFNILDDKNQRLGLKSYLNYNSAIWNIKFGFEIVDEKYDWEIYETNSGVQGFLLNSYSEQRNQATLFTDVKLSLKKMVIEAGLSYNYQSYKLDDLLPEQEDLSGDYKYKDIVAPFIGANYEFNEMLNFYSSYSYGFSYPTVEETLLPDGQINNNLKPETGNCFDLGLRLNLFEGNLYINAGAYYLLIDNLLVTERLTEDIFTGKNAGKTIHSGFELSAIALFNNKENFNLPKLKFTISNTIGQNKFSNFIDNDIDYKNKTLPGIPVFNISTTLELKYSFGLYLNLNNNSFGKQYLDDANSDFYGAYQVTHLKFGYKWSFDKKRKSLNFHFGINNLFDKRYASMILVNAPSFGGRLPRYYYPGRPRYFQGGVSFAF